jgi:FkbM family methyltransferase
MTAPAALLRARLWLVKLFDRLCRLIPWPALHKVLSAYAQAKPDLFFVQIGANDGVIYDPIYRYVKQHPWRGILVEPVGYYFQKLKENYRDNPRLVFENLAISDRDEVRDFYRIREGIDYLPQWCDGLGTFHREVLLSHRWAIPEIDDYVVTEQVRCVSLVNLLAKHAVEKLDLLSIDTEGHDHAILQQIDFDKIKPSLILYEHQYIGAADRAGWEEKLHGLGYSLTRHLGNTLAFLPLP